MRYLPTSLVLFLVLTSCSVYNKYPVSINEAVDERNVKLVTGDGSTQKVDKVTKHAGVYFVLDKGVRNQIENPDGMTVYLRKEPTNSLQLGILGSGSVIDATYEKHFYIKGSNFIAGRVGAGYGSQFQVCPYGSCPEAERFITIPLQVTMNIFGPSRFVEFGFGTTFYRNRNSSNQILYPVVGFRYCPRKRNGICIRLFANLPLGASVGDMFFSPAGVSFGIVY